MQEQIKLFLLTKKKASIADDIKDYSFLEISGMARIFSTGRVLENFSESTLDKSQRGNTLNEFRSPLSNFKNWSAVFIFANK